MRSWHFNHIDFSTYPHYPGEDLGVHLTPGATTFRLWAPTALEVELRLFDNGENGEPLKVTGMKKEKNGTWAHTEKGDLENLFYTFKVNDGEWLHEVPDPYARAVGINGIRGMIVDLAKTNPEGWEKDKGPALRKVTDWIIYELHVRDFSIAESSGMRHKGKYLAFTEKNTRSSLGEKTGLDHLKELGITHVHLLPVFDFQSVDEEKPLRKYNWGYDPQNYNAPEGSYSTDPYDGKVRIRELKSLVKSLHDEGIGVIMDVVYNHTWLTKGSVFNQTVPGYFYRQNHDGSFSNASGCGNEIASERSMVRKFIVDSLKYWISEYHIDGFRFDLMGILDLETMRVIREEMDRINPGILLYGEGWAADWSPMPEEKRAVKRNVKQMPGIAVFNDDIRDALKGNHSQKSTRGFVSGLGLREEAVKFGVVAATWHPQIVYNYVESSHEPWADEPSQCINYVSCHDNFTLYDKLNMSVQKATPEQLRRMVKLAGAVILTSQGIPFLHAGSEFCRTKNGNGNSYNAPDSVNQIDWVRKSVYRDVFDYYSKLIALRKNHPVFRLETSEKIRASLNFCIQYQVGVVSYCIKGEGTGDVWKLVVLVFNANVTPVTVPVPEGEFRIIIREDQISEAGLGNFSGESIEVPPRSLLMLAR
ncbi:MAG: type I pullulanase [Bacteroidota bacterium]